MILLSNRLGGRIGAVCFAVAMLLGLATRDAAALTWNQCSNPGEAVRICAWMAAGEYRDFAQRGLARAGATHANPGPNRLRVDNNCYAGRLLGTSGPPGRPSDTYVVELVPVALANCIPGQPPAPAQAQPACPHPQNFTGCCEYETPFGVAGQLGIKMSCGPSNQAHCACIRGRLDTRQGVGCHGQWQRCAVHGQQRPLY